MKPQSGHTSIHFPLQVVRTTLAGLPTKSVCGEIGSRSVHLLLYPAHESRAVVSRPACVLNYLVPQQP